MTLRVRIMKTTQDYAIPITAFVQASSKEEATKKVLANVGHSGVAWDMKDAEPVTRITHDQYLELEKKKR